MSGAGRGGAGFEDFFGNMGGAGFEDIFGSFFGGGGSGRGRQRGPARGDDIVIEIPLTFKELVFGVTKNLDLNLVVKCEICNGQGAVDPKDVIVCSVCNGRGSTIRNQQMGPLSFQQQVPCRECNGQGKKIVNKCHQCKGHGVYKKRTTIPVNLPKGNAEFNNEVCPQELDYIDAKKVAEKLVDKFMEHAITKLGADYIAMGHYAGVEFNKDTNQFELLKAIDENKDQTYFLCQLTQEQLAIAKEQDLATAEKKDSTGICFIGERQFTKFLENYIPNQPGDIVDIKTNKVLGKHIGVMYYTIGQRKGLNLGGMSEPYYVADKDIDKKILYVSSSSDESYLQNKENFIMSRPKGSISPLLSTQQKEQIVLDHKENDLTFKELSIKYNVSYSAVRNDALTMRNSELMH
ncbi:hypothetical protein FQA39_LY12928 [Lamprigera yunnana]|nr:hypothetical protein FQA39_LY12928 [Lamprigera yunnana]